jgi:hypothetical protein
MPEEMFAEERQSPFSPAGFLIMLVAMAAEAVVLYVLLKPSPVAVVTEVRPGEAAPTHTAAELLAPTLVMKDVVVSVPLTKGGRDLGTAVLSVAVKLGKARGRAEEEVLDLRYLQKEYAPLVEALMPRFRHELIMMASKRESYDDLQSTHTQVTILEELKAKMNEALHAHGVEPRVRELYWNTFHFD